MRLTLTSFYPLKNVRLPSYFINPVRPLTRPLWITLIYTYKGFSVIRVTTRIWGHHFKRFSGNFVNLLLPVISRLKLSLLNLCGSTGSISFIYPFYSCWQSSLLDLHVCMYTCILSKIYVTIHSLCVLVLLWISFYNHV